jgi:hypothetical protein
LGEHFFTLSEFCLACQAFVTLAFGPDDRISQKIVVVDQAFALAGWQSTRLRRSKWAQEKTDREM